MKGIGTLRGLAAIGAITLLATATACGGNESDDDDSGGGASLAAGDLSERDNDARDANNGALPPSTGGTGVAAAATSLDRKIIFTAGITLSVEDVQAAFHDVSRLALSTGGFIEKSSFANAGDERERAASLTMRVPSSAYQDTLSALRGLRGGTVKTEASTSNEVTDQYTDLQSRLRNLERTEQQYLALLQQAKTIPDILTVQERLDSVRLQVEQIQGRLKVLDDQTDLATIDVSLTPVPPVKAGGNDGPKAVSEAFTDAWAWFTEASRYVAAGLAVLAVAAVFLALPAGIVLAVALVVSRRGRASTA